MSAIQSLSPRETLTVVMVTISSLFLVACGIFTVLSRTYLYNYYIGAHIALMAIFVAIFIISHHIFKVRRLLHHREKTFLIWQCVVNGWYLACCLVTALGYSVLSGMAIHTNYDYVTGLVLSWCTTGLMTYLCVLVYHRAWTERTCRQGARDPQRMDEARGPPLGQSQVQMNTFHGRMAENTSQEFSDGTSDDSFTGLVKDKEPSRLKLFCRYLLRVLYYLSQGLLMFLFLFTAYHPCCVIDDTIRYREDVSMVTVTVRGHRPLALFVKCAGTGSETILFENGLGGMVYMGWNFIPQNLSQTYRVCAYDRRGYGWSEGIEQDYPDVVLSQPQWAGTNVDFLEKLVDAASIPTPFFYVGHSYGGYHMTLLSLRRPDVIKGLVFLDSARFSPLRTLQSLIGVVANIHATGLLRLAMDLNIINYRKLFSSVVDFSAMTPTEEQRLLSIFRSGNFFSTYAREAGPLVQTKYAFENLESELQNRTIDRPVLVIDAGDRSGGEWLSSQHFPQYNSNFYRTVNGTDHQSLIYSKEYSWRTKDLIDEFIQNVTRSASG